MLHDLELPEAAWKEIKTHCEKAGILFLSSVFDEEGIDLLEGLDVAAYKLARDHEITVYEAADYVGGHTNTIDVEYQGRDYAVDTGFIVFNDWTYPEFIRLMDELGVESQPSSMSFSVSCEKTGLEYNGTSRNALFAQRSNLLRPSFYRMIRDILRFNREAPELLARAGDAAEP